VTHPLAARDTDKKATLPQSLPGHLASLSFCDLISRIHFSLLLTVVANNSTGIGFISRNKIPNNNDGAPKTNNGKKYSHRLMQMMT
jgi:hypothetical protein